MMKEVFVKTELSRTHKNHCVRATAITFWSDAEIPNQHIQQISGHKRAETPIHYDNRMSTKQLKKCSDLGSSSDDVELSSEPQPLKRKPFSQLQNQKPQSQSFSGVGDIRFVLALAIAACSILVKCFRCN